jgi:hypothetical protein
MLNWHHIENKCAASSGHLSAATNAQQGGITTTVWRKPAFFMVMACALPLAHAEFYGFDCITNNSAANCPSGTSLSTQFFVQVLPIVDQPNQVQFTFYNLPSGAASSITDVYFDDGTLLGIAAVIDSAGVNFTQGGSPPNLPGGNTISPPFETTAGFLADSDSPMITANGVNPGEHLDIIFNLIDGKTFADTIAALNGPLGVGDDLRIGIHVQGFANGGSEAFVSNPGGPRPDPFEVVTSVPEPTSVVLLGSTLLGVCLLLRKRFAA